MSLFQVKGWNIGDKVAVDSGKSKNKKKVQKKAKDVGSKKDGKTSAKDKKRNREQVEEEDVNDNVEEEEDNDGNEEAVVKSTSSENKVAKSTPLVPKLTPLQQKMMNKLAGSRFRWINEQLYTSRSEDALRLIKEQPELFDAYHEGFRSQVQNWPENPVDVFVDEFKYRSKKPVNAPGGLPGLVDEDKKIVIADMGCGEALLAKNIMDYVQVFNKKNGGNKKFKKNDKSSRFNKLKKLDVEIHSFDLKKINNRITVADVRNVPLPDNSCTVVVFCLALMGTNFLDFINEAYRILAPRGELWIAEIKSRFNDVKDNKQSQQQGEEFVNALKLLGFFHKRTDAENKMFIRFEFFKPPQDIIEERKQKLERRQKFIEVETEKEELIKKRETVPEGEWLLKPCIYKRR